MSEPTRLPSIPSLDAFTPQQRSVLNAIKESLEVRLGVRGDPLDTAITFRDLLDSGMATVRTSGRRPSLIGQSGSIDSTIPPAITGLSVDGAYSSIILTWNTPLYSNHAYVEVWRGTADQLGQASLIGTTSASVYSDACGENQSFYYWVRAVSTSDVNGAFNSVHGTLGSTAPDVPYLLTLLSDQITESQLYQTLGARIDLIDSPASVLGSVNARVAAAKTELNGTIATISDRVTLLESYDQTLIQRINEIIVVDQGQASDIYLEQLARVSADEALTTQINAVSAVANANTAAIQAEQTARATQDTALATSISTLATNVANNYATITSLNSATTTLNSAIATSASQLTSRLNNVGGAGSAVTIEQAYSTQASVNTGLLGQYTVKIDNNGYVSGFGLASTAAVDGTGVSSEFYVRADRFAIGSPGQSKVTPFIVNTNPNLVYNGVPVPAGVYMDAAYIKRGSITNVQIGNAAIDDAKVANLSAEKLTTGLLDSDRINVNTLTGKLALFQSAYINNANIVSLSADKILAGTITASLTIQSPTINTGTLNGGQIFVPDNINWKFKVDSSGNVSIRNSASGARLEISNNVIKVFDSNGVVRVKLGDLTL